MKIFDEINKMAREALDKETVDQEILRNKREKGCYTRELQVIAAKLSDDLDRVFTPIEVKYEKERLEKALSFEMLAMNNCMRTVFGFMKSGDMFYRTPEEHVIATLEMSLKLYKERVQSIRNSRNRDD